MGRLLSWRLIGPAVVVGAIWWAGPAEVLAVFAQAKPLPLLLAACLSLPQAAIRASRWYLLLRGVRFDIGFRDSTAMYMMGMTLGAVSPGKLGDFIKVAALHKRGCPLGLAVAYNVLDRLLDVGFILVAGYAGMWYFSNYFASQLHVVNIIAAVAGVAFVLLVANRRVVKRAAVKLVPARYRPQVRAAWEGLAADPAGGRVLWALHLLAWTAASWMLQFFAFWLCSVALDLNVPFLYLSACATLVSLSSFLPITVAGAGTRDAIFVLLLGQLGLTSQQSLALSCLVLAVFLVNCVVFYLVSVVTGRGGERKGVPQHEDAT